MTENGGDEEPGLSFLAENCAAYGTPGLQPVSQRGAPDQDHALIGRAREIGTALRASNSDRDRLAGWLLKELADLAERRQSSVMVLGSQLDRAAKLAQAITAAPLATTSGDDAWTVQDVLNVALGRGMDQLEKLYDAGHAPEVGWRPGGAR